MYNLILKDKSIINSDTQNWKDISKETRVLYQGQTKTVFLCTLPVVKIQIFHNDLQTEVDVPEDCQVYRAMRASTTFHNGRGVQEVLGQCVGLVKDGEVVEERLLNHYQNIIQGWRI